MDPHFLSFDLLFYIYMPFPSIHLASGGFVPIPPIVRSEFLLVLILFSRLDADASDPPAPLHDHTSLALSHFCRHSPLRWVIPFPTFCVCVRVCVCVSVCCPLLCFCPCPVSLLFSWLSGLLVGCASVAFTPGAGPLRSIVHPRRHCTDHSSPTQREERHADARSGRGVRRWWSSRSRGRRLLFHSLVIAIAIACLLAFGRSLPLSLSRSLRSLSLSPPSVAGLSLFRPGGFLFFGASSSLLRVVAPRTCIVLCRLALLLCPVWFFFLLCSFACSFSFRPSCVHRCRPALPPTRLAG